MNFPVAWTTTVGFFSLMLLVSCGSREFSESHSDAPSKRTGQPDPELRVKVAAAIDLGSLLTLSGRVVLPPDIVHYPTSLAVEDADSVVVVDNNGHRILRVAPRFDRIGALDLDMSGTDG